MKEPLLSSMPTLLQNGQNALKIGTATRPQLETPAPEISTTPASFVKRCKSCSLPSTSRFGCCSYCATPLNRPGWSPRLGMLLIAGTTVACTLWVTADEAWVLPTPSILPSITAFKESFKPISPPKFSWPQISLTLPKLPELVRPAKPKMKNPFTPPPATTPSVPNLQTLPATIPTSKPAAPIVQAIQPTETALTCGGFPATNRMQEPDFGPYLTQVQQKIRAHWQPPKIDQSKHVVVLYRIACNGQLLQARVQTSSGLAIADQAALSAIRRAAPFPALPATYTGKSVEVEFEFDYEMTGRKALTSPLTPKK